MNPWLNDSSPAANNHAGFGVSADGGAMPFMPPAQTINPAQFQNPTFLNGAGRTSSPAFHNPLYQTNSVIPSKRPREEGMGTSPRQTPGGLPTSRSQTPGGQGPYPGYNAQANGVPAMSNAPTPFQHLQATSNATPSPTIQQFNNLNQGGGGGGPQRLSTASPSSFSPQHGPPHASPGPSDHVSRGGTPHDNPQGFAPNGSFGPGFNQPKFGPNGMGQMPLNAQMAMGPQHQGISAAQRNYQMQLQAQARHMQAQAQAQAHAQAQAQAQAQTRSVNGMPNSAGAAMANAPMNQTPSGASFHPPRPSNPEEFLKGLQAFMAAKGRPVDLNPVVCGRPLPLLRLYAAVVRLGGSQKISKLNQWPFVAQQFGIPPPQQLQAAQELQNYWMANLAPYETAWQFSQKQRAAQAAMQNQLQNQMSPPSRDLQQHGPDSGGHHQRNSSDLMSMRAPPGPMPPQPPPPPPMMNGFGGQQPPHPPGQPDAAGPSQHRATLSRPLDPQPLSATMPAPVTGPPAQKRPQTATVKAEEVEPDTKVPLKKPIEDPFKPDVLPPSRFHGPINMDEVGVLGQQISDAKPTAPSARELGIIDIHALTMAIKSGLHAETRVALDTLVTLSTESTLQLSLADCDDLMDTLLDCAQDQIDFLVENAAEVSDEMLLPSYEELVRAGRIEAECLQDAPEFGSLAYDLERAADRLICVTTLIRNFSFYEANFGVLGQPEVLKLLSTVIRYLGTKEMVLRGSRNTLDFMKDVVIYLSNLSTSLQLPGKEEALCLLHFLLSFAPTPPPVSSSSDKVTFTTYTPTLHKYMPSAVDSLAKLLARDEPNRTYYKAIFSADYNSNPAYELLTRTFGLAIAPVPTSPNHTRALVEARKPFLLQGMLAAEILAGLAPGSDHPLARSWLESDDGFAGNLLRLVTLLSAERSIHGAQRPPAPPQPGRNIPEPDPNGYGAITSRAMAVLKTLVQKSRTLDEHGSVIVPTGVLPKKEYLLGAMIKKDIDPGVLRQLCIYAGLED